MAVANGGDLQSASESVLHSLEPRLDALRSELADTDRRVRELVRERPFVALALAVGTGFLMGRILRRF
ncbi:MAG: hypothetical protein AB7V27_05455 [Candidatus Binatia bacterium]